MVARQARRAAGGERAGDRGELVGLLALGIAYARLATDEAPADRRLIRQLLDLHEQARALPQLLHAHFLSMPARSTCFLLVPELAPTPSQRLAPLLRGLHERRVCADRAGRGVLLGQAAMVLLRYQLCACHVD